MAEKDHMHKLGKNDVYSDYKVLKFWTPKIEVFIVFMLHPAHWKAAERPKGSTSLHCSNFRVIQPFFPIINTFFCIIFREISA